MSPTETEIETALLAAASTITVADVVDLGKFFAKLLGGHAQAADWHAAQAAAIREALDVAEEVEIAKETKP